MVAYASFATVDKILEQRKALYVKNVSPKPTKILIIDYPTPEGKKAYRVPRTSIPFNICDYVDPDSLRSSDSFRKLLNKQMLVVVDEEDAEKTLADPELRKAFNLAEEEANNTYKARSEEAKKVRGSGELARDEAARQATFGLKAALQTALSGSMDPTLAKALGTLPANQATSAPAPKVNQRLVALETKVKAGAIDSAGVMTELMLLLGDLEPHDLESIAAGSFWPVEAQKWARERVAFVTAASR